ncbi:MAG: TadE-like protein [Chloroflexota bacterium]|jgi:Flp pilus assembly protein TadG|nr:TadE-like protein [Chloroflexota bacterium]
MTRDKSRGQSLVEFAVILPVIAMVVLGLFDLGRAVFTYNTLSQAARQANRTAIVDQNTDRVKAMAVAAAPTIGLSSSNVSVCFKTANSAQTSCSSSTDNCSSADRVIGCLAIVTASISYVPMTPVISIFWSNISLSSTSIGPIDYVCPTGAQTTCP